MTYSYKSTDKLEAGDYIYWPDFAVFTDGSLSSFAVCRVNHIRHSDLTVIVVGSREMFKGGRKVHLSKRIDRGSDRHVRYIGKRPPWALESA